MLRAGGRHPHLRLMPNIPRGRSANISRRGSKSQSLRRNCDIRISTRTRLTLIDGDSFSCMRITFPSIPVIPVRTTMALHITHRPTNHTNYRVQRSGITLRTRQRLLLVDEQVIQYERQLRRAINRGEVEDNFAVYLGGNP